MSIPNDPMYKKPTFRRQLSMCTCRQADSGRGGASSFGFKPPAWYPSLETNRRLQKWISFRNFLSIFSWILQSLLLTYPHSSTLSKHSLQSLHCSMTVRQKYSMLLSSILFHQWSKIFCIQSPTSNQEKLHPMDYMISWARLGVTILMSVAWLLDLWFSEKC